jgi:hypothetical protein
MRFGRSIGQPLTITLQPFMPWSDLLTILLKTQPSILLIYE